MKELICLFFGHSKKVNLEESLKHYDGPMCQYCKRCSALLYIISGKGKFNFPVIKSNFNPKTLNNFIFKEFSGSFFTPCGEMVVTVGFEKTFDQSGFPL